MMELFRKWGAFVFSGILVAFAIWHAATAVAQWRSELDIEIAEAAKEAADAKTESASLKTTVERTDRNVEKLTRLNEPVRLLTQLSLGIVEPESPTVLNKVGKRISSEIEGEKVAMNFVSAVAPKVQGWLPNDIHQYAFDYIYDQVSEDPNFGEHVRLVARDNRVNEWVVVDVISFELRDAVLRLGNQ